MRATTKTPKPPCPPIKYGKCETTLRNTNTQWTKDWKENLNSLDTKESIVEFDSAPLISSLQGAFANIFDIIFSRLTTDEANIKIISTSLEKTNSSFVSLSGVVSLLNKKTTSTYDDLVSLSGALATTNTRMSNLG